MRGDLTAINWEVPSVQTSPHLGLLDAREHPMSDWAKVQRSGRCEMPISKIATSGCSLL